MADCKKCGGCDTCDRCSHCGNCKNCGKFIAQPYWFQPIWVAPMHTPINPWYTPISPITWSYPTGVTITTGTGVTFSGAGTLTS